jgi:sugar lactone lactonase YvrE
MRPRGARSKVIFRFCLSVFALLVAGCAGGGGTAPAPVLALLAGDMRGVGAADGTGAAASFNNPDGVATDSAGNVYVADRLNHTIRKITPAGVVTTLAGTAGIHGSTDGTGAAARFNHPDGVATDSAGNFYVADTRNHTIRKITPTGVVGTLAGAAGVRGSTDGTGAAARFTYPNGVATDSAGNLYVADWGNSTIRKITPAGVVTTLAGTAGVRGSTDGTGAAARFNSPSGVATDSAGNVYVADMYNHTIRKITPAGVVTTLAGTAGASGSTDGTGAAARFKGPISVAADSAGNVYVADTFNHTIRKITPVGVVTTLAGTAGVEGSTDGTGAAARFYPLNGVAADSAGNVYVADSFSDTIRKITPAGVVTTLAGRAGVQGSTDGTGAAAHFNLPMGVATDSAGNVYVADRNNNTIRKITPAGVVTTLAGTAGAGGSTDGTGPAARFSSPTGVAADSAGNVYVADAFNYTIRKITPAGVVSTVAGVAGQQGFVPGPLPGRLGYPAGLAVSGTSLYITLLNGVAVVQNRP